ERTPPTGSGMGNVCMKGTVGFLVATVVLIPLGAHAPARPEQKPTAEQAKFFETQVLPILQAHCLACHGGEKKVKGGLRLTSRETLLKGGNSGPAVIPAKPEESLLVQAIHYQDLKMPPKGKLPQAQVDILTRWVQMGAPYAEGVVGPQTAARQGLPPVNEKARAFWSFKPVVRSAVPQVKDPAWVRNPIDAFVLAKLEEKGFRPAPPADKVSLLRRVYYTVTGLPPTPADVDAFLTDPSPDAYEKVVDRLLDS